MKKQQDLEIWGMGIIFICSIVLFIPNTNELLSFVFIIINSFGLLLVAIGKFKIKNYKLKNLKEGQEFYLKTFTRGGSHINITMKIDNIKYHMKIYFYEIIGTLETEKNWKKINGKIILWEKNKNGS